MDTTRNHIVKVSELETLLDRLDFLWFINPLECSENYKRDKTVENIIEPQQNHNDSIHRFTELRNRNKAGSSLYNEYNEKLTALENDWSNNENNIKYQRYKQSIMIPIQKINIKKDGIELVNQKLQHKNAKEQIKYADDIIDSEKEHIFCKYYGYTSSTHINELKRLLLQNVNKLLAVPKFKNKTKDDIVFKTLTNTIIYDIFYKIIIKTTIMDAKIEDNETQPMYIQRELNTEYLNSIEKIIQHLKIPNCEKIKFTDQNNNKKYYDKYNTSVLIEGFKKHCERENLAFSNAREFTDSYKLNLRQGVDDANSDDDADSDNSNSGGDGFKSRKRVEEEKQLKNEYLEKKKQTLLDAKNKAHGITIRNKQKQKQKAIVNQNQRKLYNNFMTYINNNKILKENMIFYWGSDDTKWFEHYNSNYISEDTRKLFRLYNSQAGLDTKINEFLMDSSTLNLKIKFFIFFCIGFLYQDDVIFYRRIQSRVGTTINAQFGMDVNNQGEYYNNDNSVKDNILYCTNNGTIPNIEYTDYNDALGLPENNNTENDNCTGDKCYPTMDVVENKQNLNTGTASKTNKRVGRQEIVLTNN